MVYSQTENKQIMWRIECFRLKEIVHTNRILAYRKKRIPKKKEVKEIGNELFVVANFFV